MFKKLLSIFILIMMSSCLTVNVEVPTTEPETPIETPKETPVVEPPKEVSQTECQANVVIKDSALELLIRDTLTLNKTVVGSIQANELIKLERLENDTVVALTEAVSFDEVSQAAQSNISDLTGLECATKLTNLGLVGEFNSLAPLKNLPLQEIRLYAPNVVDLDVLESLSSLKRLTLLFSEQLKDISPIAALVQLEHLNLSKNSLENISALSSLSQLKQLILYQNNISDLTALQNLHNLEVLWLSTNKIKDVSTLKNLQSLKQLYLYDNEIAEIDALGENLYIASGDVVNIRSNPLNSDAALVVRMLQERGAEVLF